MGKILFSREEHDSILGISRPNGTSKTWYLKETGRPFLLHTMGIWNIFDENNEPQNTQSIEDASFPRDISEISKFGLPDEITEEDLHLYLIKVNNPKYFKLSEDIGFDVIHPKYLNDIREGRCKIIIHYPYEGYSGMDGNRDMNIIEKWRIKSDLPEFSVHFFSGNLIADRVAARDGLKINIKPVALFDNWNAVDMETPYIEYNPVDDKNLFLSYNRNPREQRTIFMLKLLNENILDRGLVSFREFHAHMGNDYANPKMEVRDETIEELGRRLPIEIEGADLNYNLAGNITYDDYERTFISVITETLSGKDCLFLSEKTWKPINVGHPFMILGNQHTLQYLKSLGYKTFDKWIDESYDEEPDLTDRTLMIVKELQKLSTKSVEELKSMRAEMDDILKHNKKLFIKQLENNWTDNQNSTILINEILKIYSDLERKQPGQRIDELVYRMWDGGDGDYGNVNNMLVDIERHDPESIYVMGPEEWEIGGMFNVPEFIDKLNKTLIEKKISFKAFFGTDDITKKFYRGYDRFPKENTEIITFPMFWAYYTYVSLLDKNRQALELSTQEYSITKLFMSLNNKPHYHRCELMDLLVKRDLLKYGNVSWIMPHSNPGNYNFKYWEPVKLGFDDNYTETLDSYVQIPKEYKRSFVNVIPESTLNIPFLTEKTFTAIALSQPFLIYGAPGIHKSLTNHGFELYDEIFDYSFDELEVGRDRINGILDNLEEIKDKNLTFLRGLIEPKIKRNKEKLLEIVADLDSVPDEFLKVMGRYEYVKETYSFLINPPIDLDNLPEEDPEPEFEPIIEEEPVVEEPVVERDPYLIKDSIEGNRSDSIEREPQDKSTRKRFI